MTDPAAWPVGVGVYAQWGAGKVGAPARAAQSQTLTTPLGLCVPPAGLSAPAVTRERRGYRSSAFSLPARKYKSVVKGRFADLARQNITAGTW